MPSTPSPRVVACGCANPRPQLTAYVYWSLLQQGHPGKTQSGGLHQWPVALPPHHARRPGSCDGSGHTDRHPGLPVGNHETSSDSPVVCNVWAPSLAWHSWQPPPVGAKYLLAKPG